MTGENNLRLFPAGAAFDAIADKFDDRFNPWLSVAAQRRAVYAELTAAFPVGSHLIEIGGGTGIDAAWMTERGRSVFLTDASPSMARIAARRLGEESVAAVPAEQLGLIADRGERFDGAFSNFAGLNCVTDLTPVGEALGRLIRPGGKVALVIFGRHCPGEMVTEAIRRRPKNMFRRLSLGDVPATLSGRKFTVRYHRRRDVERAMAPWFRPAGRRAIGLFVPPSAAEPWISNYPRALDAFEGIDRRLSRPLAMFGDHILHMFERLPAGDEAA